MAKRSLLLLTAACAAMPVMSTWADDLGVYGQVWPIEEMDMREAIAQRIETRRQNGELEALRTNMVNRGHDYSKAPPGKKLPRAGISRNYFHIPLHEVPEDILDPEGRLLYPAGTVVNSLEYVPFGAPMIFFDGEDPDQKAWVHAMLKDDPKAYMPVLTNGPIRELMRDWQFRLWFDQAGRYTKLLDIRALPAVVRQDGYQLRIDEIALQ